MFYTLIKTWVFDQSKRAQGVIYIMIKNKDAPNIHACACHICRVWYYGS